MKLPDSMSTVTPLSKGLALLIFVLTPFIGFYFGMLYQRSQTPIQIVKVSNPQTAQDTSVEEKRGTVALSNQITFEYPNGWHVAKYYSDLEYNPTLYYIDKVPWEINAPSDRSPHTMLTVYSELDEPQVVYDALISNFQSLHENITVKSIPQESYGEILHYKGIISEPSLYGGGNADFYILKTWNSTNFPSKESLIITIGPGFERLDDSNQTYEEILQSVEPCFTEYCAYEEKK